LVENAVEPHPTRLPGLYWVGEAFSGTQGWIEGALETVEILARKCDSPGRGSGGEGRWNPSREHIIFQDRRIKVTGWADKHPGSKGAIDKYLGKDVTEVITHLSHPPYALALMYHMHSSSLLGYPKLKVP
jgi:hypothetical protein